MCTAVFSGCGEPFLMRFLEDLGDDFTRNHVHNRACAHGLSEIHETIEQSVAVDVLMLLLHVPAAVASRSRRAFA